MLERLQQNVARVRERIAIAAERAGRRAEEVQLVAVTKYVDADLARQLVEAGCRDLGESRPQELWNKAEQLRSLAVRWHLIGHLQRNKVRRTLPLVSLVHSGDSPRLLAEIAREIAPGAPPVPVLLEVNISGDEAKHGFAPDQIEPLLPELAAYSGIRICGLMAMSGVASDVSQTQREFAAVRTLRDRLQRVAPPNMSLAELSMGMSDDFELAIAEGATLVRIGSALFEGVTP